MARYVEDIVACHQAASKLRAAGKPIWSKTIDVKSIIHEDQDNETPEHICSISKRIAELIRSKAPASYFDIGHDDFDCDFVDAVEEMESSTIKTLAEANANGDEAVDIFNGWLETIYDWADVNRIWLGN